MDGWKMSFLLGWPIFRCYVNFLESKPQQQKNGNPISNRFPQKAIHLHLSRSWWCRGHSLSVHWLPRGDLVISKRGFEIVGAVKNESPVKGDTSETPTTRYRQLTLKQEEEEGEEEEEEQQQQQQPRSFRVSSKTKRNGTNHSDNKQKDVKNVGLPGISKK